MSVTNYKDDISKDWAVWGNKTYHSQGQGCGTIWYKNVPTARKALVACGYKAVAGSDLFNCALCDCHYSVNHELSGKFPSHACTQIKELFAKQFE